MFHVILERVEFEKTKDKFTPLFDFVQSWSAVQCIVVRLLWVTTAATTTTTSGGDMMNNMMVVNGGVKGVMVHLMKCSRSSMMMNCGGCCSMMTSVMLTVYK